MVTEIMLGKKPDLWICYIPDDRQRFADAMAILNPQEITFGVLGPIDLAWIHPNESILRIIP
ncbi:MAG: hypothetical protein ACYC0X_34360 [Pirellulaceae bacterium]